jgi:hypothetical protein
MSSGKTAGKIHRNTRSGVDRTRTQVHVNAVNLFHDPLILQMFQRSKGGEKCTSESLTLQHCGEQRLREYQQLHQKIEQPLVVSTVREDDAVVVHILEPEDNQIKLTQEEDVVQSTTISNIIKEVAAKEEDETSYYSEETLNEKDIMYNVEEETLEHDIARSSIGSGQLLHLDQVETKTDEVIKEDEVEREVYLALSGHTVITEERERVLFFDKSPDVVLQELVEVAEEIVANPIASIGDDIKLNLADAEILEVVEECITMPHPVEEAVVELPEYIDESKSIVIAPGVEEGVFSYECLTNMLIFVRENKFWTLRTTYGKGLICGDLNFLQRVALRKITFKKWATPSIVLWTLITLGYAHCPLWSLGSDDLKVFDKMKFKNRSIVMDRDVNVIGFSRGCIEGYVETENYIHLMASYRCFGREKKFLLVKDRNRLNQHNLRKVMTFTSGDGVWGVYAAEGGDYLDIGEVTFFVSAGEGCVGFRVYDVREHYYMIVRDRDKEKNVSVPVSLSKGFYILDGGICGNGVLCCVDGFRAEKPEIGPLHLPSDSRVKDKERIFSHAFRINGVTREQKVRILTAKNHAQLLGVAARSAGRCAFGEERKTWHH